MKKRITALLFSAFFVFSLCSCGEVKENTELLNYRNNVDTFCKNVSYINDKINSIDVDDEKAVSELLSNMDTLDEQFKSFSELDEPSEFQYLSQTINEASAYVTEAVKYYHMAYSEDCYNASYGDYADKNLERACKRLNICLSFMRGETPEDDSLSVIQD